MRAYVKTISALHTAAGSTELPVGLKITRVQNDDSTNFVTISFDAAIGTDPEGTLLAASAWNFDSKDSAIVAGGTIYYQSDTAGVDFTILGVIG